MGQEKMIRWDRKSFYMGQESLLGWDRRRRFDGTGEVDFTSKQGVFFGSKCPIFTRVKMIVTRIVR
jgi:hypothetical protein